MESETTVTVTLSRDEVYDAIAERAFAQAKNELVQSRFNILNMGETELTDDGAVVTFRVGKI